MSLLLGDPSLEGFVPPGIVTVSPAALRLAQDFFAAIKRDYPDQDWIVSYDWSDSRRVRLSATSAWEDLGPGLDFGAYERSVIPVQAIQAIDDFEFLIKLPVNVKNESTNNVIDVDPERSNRIVYR